MSAERTSVSSAPGHEQCSGDWRLSRLRHGLSQASLAAQSTKTEGSGAHKLTQASLVAQATKTEGGGASGDGHKMRVSFPWVCMPWG